ncbi:MAG: alpha/beta hydrolase [Vicinamibacterales bacterium]
MIVERTVTTAQGTLRVLDAGAGWPVLLIHAFPLSADMWRPQLEAVPQGWRYVAPDLRGFGRSPAGPTPPGVDDYAADVEAVLDALEIETATIGGLSMGGYVTFALHRRAPERFTSLVLADTKAEADTADGRDARRKMSALVNERGVGAVADSMLPKLLSEQSRTSELPGVVRALIEGNSVQGVDHAIQALMTRPDSTGDLATLRLPVLVIVGEEDALTPRADSERIVAATERSQLVVVPGAGHLSNLEAPAAFSTALANFLRSSL